MMSSGGVLEKHQIGKDRPRLTVIARSNGCAHIEKTVAAVGAADCTHVLRSQRTVGKHSLRAFLHLAGKDIHIIAAHRHKQLNGILSYRDETGA